MFVFCSLHQKLHCGFCLFGCLWWCFGWFPFFFSFFFVLPMDFRLDTNSHTKGAFSGGSLLPVYASHTRQREHAYTRILKPKKQKRKKKKKTEAKKTKKKKHKKPKSKRNQWLGANHTHFLPLNHLPSACTDNPLEAPLNDDQQQQVCSFFLLLRWLPV